MARDERRAFLSPSAAPVFREGAPSGQTVRRPLSHDGQNGRRLSATGWRFRRSTSNEYPRVVVRGERETEPAARAICAEPEQVAVERHRGIPTMRGSSRSRRCRCPRLSAYRLARSHNPFGARRKSASSPGIATPSTVSACWISVSEQPGRSATGWSWAIVLRRSRQTLHMYRVEGAAAAGRLSGPGFRNHPEQLKALRVASQSAWLKPEVPVEELALGHGVLVSRSALARKL